MNALPIELEQREAPAITSPGRRGTLARLVAALRKDRRGVAAVEFAFIVPVLLCMYFITLEAAQAIEVNRKVSRVSSTVADLITQMRDVTANQVRDIMRIGLAIIKPYNRSVPRLEVVAIQFGTEAVPVARVAWSVKLNSAGQPVAVAARNSVVTDTDLNRIRVAGAFYIKVSANLAYRPVVAWQANTNEFGLLSAFSNINMGETYYLRPRINSGAIPCSTCP